ncbi:MogA/MoaB family molybdenum cofactor biosynthesis protein [Stackebrandtia nassauensis]|uniref:Molybdenum cofactor synthesis domain protein n=1 Tax=Stackebrandtia nassauensis (strain DSM 44728 / CIP 108903 / NRRL B-16338 / NBRC 102104 / LLR-40K-21) TaxID=446470 RepID=D3Q465_STANL|nr:MogA/MoaB family molybdenum cofactor biosynthesis protein [Stackebrandtia nassauensis]ADD45950.1 molybdenum cofactor synthesis domain protein [Stackebrandtia nassauensis DSM 44728]
MRARVIVASTRAASGVYEDTSGPLLRRALTEAANVDEAVVTVVPDGDEVRQAIAAALDEGVDVIITSGGTGLTSKDRTPEMTREFIDYEVPGVAEAIRARGLAAGVDSAILSRGIAGVAGSTFIVNLAGSQGAAKDGMAVLSNVLGHIVDQIHDGDH